MKHYRELERAIENPKQNKTESKLLEGFACSNPIISSSGFLSLYLQPNRLMFSFSSLGRIQLWYLRIIRDVRICRLQNYPDQINTLFTNPLQIDTYIL